MDTKLKSMLIGIVLFSLLSVVVVMIAGYIPKSSPSINTYPSDIGLTDGSSTDHVTITWTE